VFSSTIGTGGKVESDLFDMQRLTIRYRVRGWYRDLSEVEESSLEGRRVSTTLTIHESV
jgi:hypothetical protein